MSHRHLARICCAMLACAAHTCLAGDPALSSLAMEHFRDTATVADDPIAGVTRVVTEKGYVEHHGLLRAVWNDEYLSANIDRKSGRRSFEVVATITYRGSRRDYGSAKFQGTNGPASAPATLVKATSVSCPTGECTYTDQISFGVEENLLRSLAARPAGEAPKLWHYTLVTKSNGDYAGALSSAEIAGFLAKVDEYTGAVPPPSMPNAPAVKPDLGLGGLRVEGTELQPERGGVLVTAVNRGSLAEKAGIIVGDIVREVDGHVVKTPPELQAAVAASHAPVTLKVYRGTAAITLTAAP